MTIPDKLTAADVRKLPVGTQVTWHGRDKYGIHTMLDCTVVQSGKKKALAYTGFNYLTETKPIRDLPNRYFTIKEE